MIVSIKVNLRAGAYFARVMGRGITASNTESPLAAAKAVCRKAELDPELLEQQPGEYPVVFTHPG